MSHARCTDRGAVRNTKIVSGQLVHVWQCLLSSSLLYLTKKVVATVCLLHFDTSVGITKKVNGRAAMASDSERRNFFRGPLWDGPNFCKFCITPTTDFTGYSKENLKIQTGVSSLPLPFPPILPLPCYPLPLPLPSFPISPFP